MTNSISAMRSLIAGLIILALTSSAASAESITDRARVIDGDTIEIHGERIHILDIDAPELDQTCFLREGGTEWPCGMVAAASLSEWIAQSPITCETYGTDNAGRWLAHCDASTIGVATWMAANGWALPNQDCQCQEVRAWAAFAKSKNAGIWSSSLLMPWEWRKAH